MMWMYNTNKVISDIKLWAPYLDPNLPEDVRLELVEYYTEPNTDVMSFSWDNEDNESCPAIAGYLSGMGIYQCIILVDDNYIYEGWNV